MNNTPWSEDELTALQAGFSFAEFDELFPGRRTYQAWRQKRSAIGSPVGAAGGATVTVAETPAFAMWVGAI